jgi:hypothetical protein
MNEPDVVSQHVRDLIDDYLNDALDEAGVGELDGLLRADAAARAYFVRYASLDTDLRLEIRARQAGQKALEVIEQQSPRGVKSKRRFWFRAVAAWAVAVSALVAVGAWLVVRPTGPTAPAREPAVAWLVNAQNCQWAGVEGGDAVGAAGDLHAGKVLELVRGLAEIRFECGASAVIEGPARLELLSATRVRLVRGKLAAKVPHSVLGFEVLSPQGKVIDLGTEFGVRVTEEGATDVIVFDGKVEAHAGGDGRVATADGVSLTKDQSARITDGKIVRNEGPPREASGQFVRAIVAPPVIVPRVFRLSFSGPVAGTLADANGLGTGLTHRLPGTGSRLPAADPNLRMDAAEGRLELTTTRSDINRQVRLSDGEYLGIRLADLGFTGQEDFAVTATIPDMPALEDFGQFGLYAGTKSDRNIRGGLIKWGGRDPGQNTQFFVNNNGGPDTDVHKVGLLSPGTDLRLTLRRTSGKYALTVENLTDGGSSTLSIRHPEFLDRETDLFVGLFGANPYSDVRKTLTIKEFVVTVWAAVGEG